MGSLIWWLIIAVVAVAILVVILRIFRKVLGWAVRIALIVGTVVVLGIAFWILTSCIGR
jgi:hypothetical protein